MDYITTKEAAELQGCTERYIRKLCKTGSIEYTVSKSVKGKDMYLIPVSALSEQAQHKYGKQLRESMQLLPETAESKPSAKRKQREQKPLEAYSAQERDKIALWCQIIKDWMDTRASYQPGAADRCNHHKPPEITIGGINYEKNKRAERCAG